MILPMNKQVYILLSLPTKKSPESSFKKKKEKTREVEGRGSEAGFGSMFNKVWEGANRRDAIMRTTRQDMFLGRFNQFIIKIKRCFIGRIMRLPAHKWSFFQRAFEWDSRGDTKKKTEETRTRSIIFIFVSPRKKNARGCESKKKRILYLYSSSLFERNARARRNISTRARAKSHSSL